MVRFFVLCLLFLFCNQVYSQYSREKLKKVECVSSSSEFVASVTGVDNVCERAAKYCCPDGRMILDKLKLDGMTVAIVQKKMEVLF